MKIVCRLAEKVHRMGHTIFVLTSDAQQSKMLDDLMWTFSQSSFLPHAVVSTPSDYKSDERLQQTPVLIFDRQLENTPEVLINLKEDIPNTDGLNRVVEIVDQDQQVKSSGRDKYRNYKNQQFTIKTHHLQTR
jgi:DNA polymerase-3 subunit chi